MKKAWCMAATLCGLLSLSAVQAAEPMNHHHGAGEKAAIAHGVGVVKKLDEKNSRVTLRHEAMPSIGWAQMTMPFSVKDKALLEGLKVGDKVSFTLEDKKTITAIEKK